LAFQIILSKFEPPSADAYGKSLKGLGFSLIVSDLSASVNFATGVLGATIYFQTDKFAAMKLLGADFMIHQDDTYRHNPLHGFLGENVGRGIGIELRCYGVNPDEAEARARNLGHTVLAGSLDKPHGLRECVILDPDGYAWVPSIHLKS
jgi:catechol 2,3-dioxygenase-like lactoylglutathione lyase family enzyme